MPDNNLTMTISADTTKLTAQVAVAKANLSDLNANVKSLASQFVKASDEMKGSLAPQLEAAATKAAVAKAEVAALNAELKNVVHPEVTGFFGQLTSSTAEATEKVEGLTSKLLVFQEFASGLGELAVTALGVEQLGEMVRSTAETGEQIGQLSEKTGIATDVISGLRVVAGETGVSVDQLSTGIRNLSKNLESALANPASAAATNFHELGIAIRDSSGQALPLIDVLGNTAAAFGGFAEGAAKSTDAGQVFGTKIGSSLVPFLNQLSLDTIPGATQKARDLGVSFDEAAVAADTRFVQSLSDAGFSLEGLKDVASNALIPALTVLETAFTSDANGMSDMHIAAEVLADGLKSVVEVATAVVTAVEEIGDAVALLGHEFNDLMTIEKAMSEATAFDFKAAAATANSAFSAMGTDFSAELSNMASHEKTFADTHNALWSTVKIAPDVQLSPTKPAPNLAASGGADFMKDQTATLDQQNAQIEASAGSMKEANAEKLANTVQFWQGVLAAGNLTSAEEQSAQTALSKAEMAQRSNQLSSETAGAKSAADQQVQIAADAAEARKEIAASEYEAQQSVWDAEVATGKISKDQEIRDEIAAENQMYQAALAESQQEAALDAAGTAAKAKALDDIAVLTASHNAQLAKLNDDLVTQQVEDAKTVADAQKAAADATAQKWQQAFQPISQAFDTSVNGIIQGTETMQQAETKAAASIALAFIDAEAKKVTSFIAGEAMILARGLATEMGLTAASTAGNVSRLASKATTDAAGKAEDVAVGTAQINASAMKAAAGAYSAVAGVPFVGPVLAPAAAATAYAAVMAFDVLSAEGGLAIGSGVNPLVQLHENETVLPAYIAKPLNEMAQGGGAMGGGGGDTNVTNHFNISASSSGGAGDMSDAVLGALNDAIRSGSLQKYPAIARLMRR